MPTLTDDQAYAAMFHFLEQYWTILRSDDLGGLLGGMSLLTDGSTADPAMAHEWQRAVKYALNGGRAGLLEFGPLPSNGSPGPGTA